MLKLKNVIILGFIFTLVTCGGGSGSVPEAAPQIVAGPITGIATLGPITGGSVTVYDFSAGVKGEALKTATTKTDATGTYTLNLISKNKAILVCVTGGSYEEVASSSIPKVSVSFTTTTELCAVANYQTGQENKVAITYYTNLAYALALNSIKNSVAVTTAITNSNKAISDWLGLDVITTFPIDLNAESSRSSDLLTANYKYGFANAAISSLLKSISLIGGGDAFQGINSKVFALRAFDDVKADGILNGKTKAIGNEAILKIGTQALTRLVYRERLAENLILFANSTENISLLKASSPNDFVSKYASEIASFTGAIFESVPAFNAAPVANDDVVEINVSSARVIKVLNNDSDSNLNDDLIVIIDTLPVNGGSVTLDARNKAIIYKVPNSAVAGDSFSFTYFAYDGYVKSQTPATVTINIVNRINVAPIAKPITVNMVSDTTKNILLSTLAADAEDNPLTVIIDSQPASYDPINKIGSRVVVKVDSIDFIAQRSIDSNVETFTYHVNDGLLDSNIAMVTINTSPAVNTAPIAEADTKTVMKGVAEIKIDVLSNDSDLDTPNNNLIIVSVSDPVTGIGSVRYDQNFIYYTPPVKESAAVNEIFTYIISDGSIISQPATVSLSFIAFNNPPVAIGDSSRGYTEPIIGLVSSNLITGVTEFAPIFVYFDAEGDLEKQPVSTTYKWYGDGDLTNLLGEGATLVTDSSTFVNSLEVHITVYAQTGSIKGDTVIAIAYTVN